ncbi:MAG TPA: hypothetical protein VF006_08440 [Longimicrobium sp.]
MTDPLIITELSEFNERLQSMHRQTYDDVVSLYWQIAREFGDGYLPFALIGGLNWSAEHRHRLYTHDRRAWIKAGPTDDDTSHLRSIVTTHDRLLSAGVRAEIDPANPSQAREAIQKAITEVTLLADLLALRFDAPVQWHPARYLGGFPVANPSELENRDVIPASRFPEAMTNTGITDDHVERQFLPLFSVVSALGDSAFGLVVRTAISWHAQGFTIQAGLSRYLAYWASVELLGAFLFDRLPRNITGRKTKPERRRAITELLERPVTEDYDCFDLVDDLIELKQPTVRTKVLVLSHWTGDRESLERALFAKVDGYSLYKIRNDIAHGNVGAHHHDFLEVVRRRLDEMKSISRSIIINVLRHSAEISSLLESVPGERGGR